MPKTGRAPSRELAALIEAGNALTSQLSLPTVLQKLVDVAVELIGARYGAMSVLGPGGEVQQFLTAGIRDDERERIGPIPQGHGLLAVILRDGASLRMEDIHKDPRSVGFPPHHPEMHTLLGVPVVSGGRIIGNLYLTEKPGGATFGDHDEELMKLLSTQAAVAIRNAELYEAESRRAEALSRLEERERIGMDLHDGVIQSIYAIGLQLEDAAERLDESPAEVQPRLEQAMDGLSRVIKDIRSYIFDLRPQVSQVSDLPGAVRGLLEDLRLNTLMAVHMETSGDFDGRLSEAQALALFHIAQEALNNVSRHSRATEVAVRLAAEGEQVVLSVQDNGVGMSEDAPADHEGQGLRNMRDRAHSVDARLLVETEPGQGTTVCAQLPLTGEARP